MTARPRTPVGTVVVTGAAGYLGRQVAVRLAGRHRVVGLDVATPEVDFDLRPMDVRDPAMADVLAAERATHVVHLAAILDGDVDVDLAHDIDVNGTANVVAACAAAEVGHLTVTSSGAAYGYHADNPVPLHEDDPLRGNATFPYSHHKRLVEDLLADARRDHPDLGQLVLRVSTVLGAGTDNLVTDLLTRRWVPVVAGARAGFVFTWDRDLVSIIEQGIRRSVTGIFNVAGDGVLSTAEVAAVLGGRAVPLPAALLRAVLGVARQLGIGRYGPEQVDFLAHRPVLANDRLVAEFGPLRKTSREAVATFATTVQPR